MRRAARGGPSAIAVLRILVREVPHFCSEKNCQTKLYTVLYMSDFQAFCTSSDTEKKKLQVSQEKAETLRINFQFVFVLRFEFFGKFFPSFFFLFAMLIFRPSNLSFWVWIF